jgi:HJR/Mrr/RecB family endonuclease
MKPQSTQYAVPPQTRWSSKLHTMPSNTSIPRALAYNAVTFLCAVTSLVLLADAMLELNFPEAVLGLVFALVALMHSTWIPATLRRRRRRNRYRRTTGAARALAEVVDVMSGPEFEQYVARILQARGYRVKNTGGPGDYGVDIVATDRHGHKLAVQCKRQTALVDQDAIRQVVAGRKMPRYGCDSMMVVTNSGFTTSARALAAANNCRLIDRTGLWGFAHKTRHIPYAA